MKKYFLVIIIFTVLITGIAGYFFTRHSDGDPFFYEHKYLVRHPLTMKSQAGEAPTSLSALIELSRDMNPNQLKKIKLKVAVSMHDVKNDWSAALLDGLKKTFQYYNVEVLAVTNGEFKVKKQIIDLKNLISLSPDIILSLPLDTHQMTDIYRDVQRAGIKLIFFDSVPNGFIPKKDYIGFVVGDSQQLGMLSADGLAQKINYNGKVALLNWKNKMFTVDQRTQGAQTAFAKHSNIQIVDQLAFQEFYEIQGLVEQLLGKHPDLAGLWTVWDTPAFEAIKTLKDKNSGAIVATVDMNKDVAKGLSNHTNLKVTAVDHPFSAGIAGALLAVLHAVQIPPPSYVVIHADLVTGENMKTMWQELYNTSYDEN